MKKTFRMIGAAMFAAVLCFGFASCGSDSDDDPIVLPDDIKPTVIDEALALPNEKLPDVMKEGVQRIIETTSATARLEKVVLVKGMEAIVYPKALTKAINDNAIVCTYTIEGGYIVIDTKSTLGEIKIPVEGAVEIVTSTGTEPAKEITLPAPSTDNAKSLCRPWGNTKFKAGVFFDKVPVWGANDSEKKDYNSIIDLKNAVVNKLIKDSNLRDEGFKLLTNNLIAANFMSNNVVYFTYHNVQKNTISVEESKWSWVDEAKGKLKTTLDNVEVNVDVRFQKGTPNKAVFIIDANLAGVGGLGVHTLSGRLVCTMTE